MLIVVYMSPSWNNSRVCSLITTQLTPCTGSNVQDLDQCLLETMLPGFEQYVKDKTRKDNILDKVKSVSRV